MGNDGRFGERSLVVDPGLNAYAAELGLRPDRGYRPLRICQNPVDALHLATAHQSKERRDGDRV